MVQKQLQIHSENILPIIKKWLYSEKDIFVRELISNSSDAIAKRKILHDTGRMTTPFSPRIDVTIDKAKKTITFSDNGIGMTSDEVEKYLAQIAFSGAEEFIKTYEVSDSFIGHFGLGFYSSYMVAKMVEVESLSAEPNQEAVLWRCDGTSNYELLPCERKEYGTDVKLYVDEENEDLLLETKLRQLLNRFCSFLPYPIYLNDSLINSLEPLWTKQPQSCSKQEYLELFRKLYPFEKEPLFWVHLNVDYPFHVKGVLYFPHIERDFDFQKSAVKLFCNRVFVSDDCKDILPEYLTMLRGAIDSPDIPLNVSRSYLQVDKTVRQLSAHMAKKVADALIAFYKNDKERFFSSWDDLSVIVKLGALQDEKFYERVKELLMWKTVNGEWLSFQEYLNRHKDQTENAIFYATTAHPDPHLLQLFEEKKIDVILASSPLDQALFAFLEMKQKDLRFCRFDNAPDALIVDKSSQNLLLDAEGKTQNSRLAEFISQALQIPTLKVEAKSLSTTALPGFVTIPEEERRMRDYLARVAKEHDLPALCHTFVVNTNSPLVQQIFEMKASQPTISQELVRHLFHLALLAGREMDLKKMNDFVKDSYSLLEKITKTLKTSPTNP